MNARGLAELVVDGLSKLIKEEDFEKAVEIAEEEIMVRVSFGNVIMVPDGNDEE